MLTLQIFVNFHKKIYNWNEAVIKTLLLLQEFSLLTQTYLITEFAMFDE